MMNVLASCEDSQGHFLDPLALLLVALPCPPPARSSVSGVLLCVWCEFRCDFL